MKSEALNEAASLLAELSGFVQTKQILSREEVSLNG
jgi:hypothetical protein